jgi:hypothetical protein
MQVQGRLVFLLRRASESGIKWVHVGPGMEAALPLCRLRVELYLCLYKYC